MIPLKSIFLAAFAFAFVACDSSKDGEGDKAGAENSKAELTIDDIETRDDGLVYVKGQDKPYGGPIFQRFHDQTPRYFAFYKGGTIDAAKVKIEAENKLNIEQFDPALGAPINLPPKA